MDKKTIIGIVLIFAVSIGYFYITAPSKDEIAKQRHTNDSIINASKKRIQDSIALAKSDTIIKSDTAKFTKEGNNNVAADNTNDKLNAFSHALKKDSSEFVIENDLFKITLLSNGGRIGKVQLLDFKTYDSLPLILFTPDSSKFNLNFPCVNNDVINTKDLYFIPFWNDKRFNKQKSIKITGTDSVVFSMRLYAGDSLGKIFTDKYIEYRYVVHGNNYLMDFSIHFKGLKEIIQSNLTYLKLEWIAPLRQQEKGLDNEKNTSTIYYKPLNDKVDYLSETKDDKKQIDTKIKWLSFKQQFFSSILIAKNEFNNIEISTHSNKESKSKWLKTTSASIEIPYSNQDEQNFDMSFYFGPNKYKILKKYKLEFERQIPLGWGYIAWISIYAVIPIFNFFEQFNWNYGIIILILTLILKIVLLPIAYKSYVSSAKMKALKPEIDEATKKLTKKEDSMKKQQVTMEIYRKAGASPMAGCIPMLLQMPILFAMFKFFPASIELRQQSFLWATDLSSYDSIWNMPFTIPFYGDHVSLFTLLMTITTIIYTKINNDMTGQANQMPGMKVMMYLMPIMFLGIFNNFSSGLSYYYFLVNIFTFAQMFLIKKLLNEDKLHAQLKANMLKPSKKKGGFQKRLEDMAKSRGMNVPAKKK